MTRDLERVMEGCRNLKGSHYDFIPAVRRSSADYPEGGRWSLVRYRRWLVSSALLSFESKALSIVKILQHLLCRTCAWEFCFDRSFGSFEIRGPFVAASVVTYAVALHYRAMYMF